MEDLQRTYKKDLRSELAKIGNNRDLLLTRIKDMQSKFLEIFESTAESQVKTNNLQNWNIVKATLFNYEEKYKKFAKEQKEFLKEKSAKEKISKYFETIYENMWKNLEKM